MSTAVTQQNPAEGTKRFHIADHLGSVRVAIDPTGARTELDYEPFGKATVAQFTVDVPRQTFIDKEKDGENGLGDFGARKYEEETGRFMSVDPLWEGQAAQSIWLYSAADPVRYVDKNGRFKDYIHPGIIEEAGEGIVPGNILSRIEVESQTTDWFLFPVAAAHFDDSTFAEGWSRIGSLLAEGTPEAIGSALHAVGDFYSHSNFVELASGYFGSNKELPTFDAAMLDPTFLHIWTREGKSGVFGRTPGTGEQSHEELNKDDATRKGYTEARDLAVRHSRKILSYLFGKETDDRQE